MTIVSDLGAIIQPKRGDHFRIALENFGTGEQERLTNQIISTTRPTLTLSEGKLQCGSFVLFVRDDFKNYASSEISAQVARQVVAPAPFALIIEMLDDRCDIVVETLSMEGCQIIGVEWSPLDFGQTAYSTLRVTIQPERLAYATIALDLPQPISERPDLTDALTALTPAA